MAGGDLGAGLHRVGRLSARIGAPVVAQGLTAGTSLLLQVIAARSLGLAEFGAFALFLALLVSAAAVYTGYVGDSLAVLDRHDPRTRSALATSALAAILLCGATAAGAALVVSGGDAALVIAYPAMLACWLCKESVRRLLIARLQFGELVGNDCVYLLGTLATLGVFRWLAGVGLLALFTAMAVGAIGAVATGLARLPRRERSGLRPATGGLRRVASFAAWRSAQAGLRPAALLAARVLVANLLSLAAVGMLEAARLVVAPLQVVINGAGSYLLPRFASAESEGMARTGRLTTRFVWILSVGTLGAGGVLVALSGPVGALLTGTAVDPLLVLGWVVYLTVWGAGLPYVTEVVARRHSRAVFTARLVDALIGLLLVAVLLATGRGVTAVPWAMALGGVYAVWRVRRLAHDTRRTS
ncbi:Membrane protein involved in the export of O-antigen and teichoic acid [Haloechinothrix alba]|uniref:Membrane protein involved in the export of O-antigen and teichoic acid n=1 Tax=Haloechinothrix alba TaxID=664784 RepID=A0A238WZN3_9PSEU|nr:oligosaccharide flippase family protein [Haloechinothrix alba]SNR52047.1 Membrane protein involved in the export of O-antigen and teichoic acid [Haloechinothrix alba]